MDRAGTLMSDDIARRAKEAIGQPWWRPTDSVLRKIHTERNSASNRRLARWGLWAAVLTHLVFGAFDIYLLPDVSYQLVVFRVLLAAVVLFSLEFGIQRAVSLEILHLGAALAIFIAGTGFLLIELMTYDSRTAFQYSVFGTIFIFATNLFFNFRFSVAAVSSVAITAVYIYATLYWMDADPRGRAINIVFLLTSLSLSLYLAWRLNLERYHTFVHSLQAQIQEQVALEKGEQLKKIAETDPLTGLKNRRAIDREFINLSRRDYGDYGHVGMIIMDVDFFKRYNDSLGHNAGDDCLVALGDILTEAASRFDGVVGRHGGEEFVVICRVRDEAHLRAATEALCAAVRERNIPHPDRTDALNIVTISAGAAMTTDQGVEDMSLLLQQADRALYASKFRSRNTYTIYDPDSVEEDASGRNLIELLKTAVSRGLVSLVYQPIFDVKSGILRGHETLMRLRDFDGTPIHPPVFIPVAEQTGLIISLGEWAIEQACRDMLEHGLGEFVSVNVSAVQLREAGFPLQVANILTKLGMPARSLALEVTEGMDIYKDAQAHRNIQHLRNLGVRIWLDDFGTGFAGLAWLNRFEFDVIKIDRSFLQDCQNQQGLNLLKDMVTMLRHQSFTVLVEGVETAEQAALLKRLGVHTMQGYHLGMPMPIAKVVQRKSARGK
jgi:diguanylate cyclase